AAISAAVQRAPAHLVLCSFDLRILRAPQSAPERATQLDELGYLQSLHEQPQDRADNDERDRNYTAVGLDQQKRQRREQRRHAVQQQRDLARRVAKVEQAVTNVAAVARENGLTAQHPSHHREQGFEYRQTTRYHWNCDCDQRRRFLQRQDTKRGERVAEK